MDATHMTISKHKAVAAMVRSFFDAFAAGVVGGTSSVCEPRELKKLMLDHYEHIAPVFLDTMFYPLAAINFDYDGISRVVAEAKERGLDMMALVRQACADDALYEAMADEYRRNFSALLAGRVETNADHLAAYTRPGDDAAEGGVDERRAIELTVRVVMYAYARALRMAAAKDDAVRMSQQVLLRLMLDAMSVLLADEATDIADGKTEPDLGQMFLRVCHTEANFKAMTDEMDRTADEIVEREGVEI